MANRVLFLIFYCHTLQAQNAVFSSLVNRRTIQSFLNLTVYTMVDGSL